MSAGLDQQRGPSLSQVRSLVLAQNSVPVAQTQRKRRRGGDGEGDREGTEEETLQGKVRRLEKELQDKDARLRALEALVQRFLSGQMRGP